MPEWLTEFFASNPSYSYVAIGSVFLLCGLGLPIPEEIVLVFAGYLCYQRHAVLWIMILACAATILVGDLLPFTLGKLFGPRLLRVKWVKFVINRQRLAVFDRWFRRRGDLVILIARFIPGLRVVAFFTGGTMRMKWGRFLFLDTCGIALTAPTFVYLGWRFGGNIEETFDWINRIEDGILYVALASALTALVWYWLRQRARRKVHAGPKETFVEPSARAATEAEPADDPTAAGKIEKSGENSPAEPGSEPIQQPGPGPADHPE